VRRVVDDHSSNMSVEAELLSRSIDVLNECVDACASDIEDDLGEPGLAEMVYCIRLCLNCSDVCSAAVDVLRRQSVNDANVSVPLLEACAAICRTCGDECERHAEMPHCRICGEVCRRCERVCRELLDAMRRDVA
jgi:hypothetical protein